MNMKIVNAKEWLDSVPQIYSYGIEDISEHAYWTFGERKNTYIHYVLTGEGIFNDKKVTAGQGFLVTANAPHIYKSSKENFAEIKSV